MIDGGQLLDEQGQDTLRVFGGKVLGGKSRGRPGVTAKPKRESVLNFDPSRLGQLMQTREGGGHELEEPDGAQIGRDFDLVADGSHQLPVQLVHLFPVLLDGVNALA